MPRALVLSLATTLLSGSLPAVAWAQEAKPPVAVAPAPPAAASPAAPAPAANPAPATTVDNDADKQRREAANDRKSMFEARLAGLHAGLLLTPEQEKMWPAVESAIRGFVTMRTEQADDRADRHQDADEDEDWIGNDPITALTDYSDDLLERGRVLKAVADSAGPLWASMTEEQKHRLPKLLRDMNPRHQPHGRRAADRDDEGDWHRRSGPSRDEPRDRDGWNGRERRDSMAGDSLFRDDERGRRPPHRDRDRDEDRDGDDRW